MEYTLLCQISTIHGELRYMDAMRLLYTLEDASERLGTVDLFFLFSFLIESKHKQVWCAIET